MTRLCDQTAVSNGDRATPARLTRIALLGNPNTGKTTLFNRLCGIRARTANFPGSTVDARVGRCVRNGFRFDAIDLPGTYSLHLDLPESRLCRRLIEGRIEWLAAPDGVVVVVDATNLFRNLLFVAEVLRTGRHAVVALNMVDLAERLGLQVDIERLSRSLGCPVVPICARSGEGVDELLEAMAAPGGDGGGVRYPQDTESAVHWANELVAACVGGERAATDTLTERLDAIFTHPVAGLGVFIATMTALFLVIFSLADVPMRLIDVMFAKLGQWLGGVVPSGALGDLLVNGVVAGVAGTVVFLPQICLLFFLISLLEDTGYLARAAFVMERLLRRFGLPGQAFVPLLSAHACAIPAIMSARLIPDFRDRVATILVAPLMSCSARLPVYVLLIGLLFADNPLAAGLAFTACYALGAGAAVGTAFILRRTILKGRARPMVIELPSYKRPSVRTALLTTLDRARLFIRKAGTVIMAICIILWWLSAYPRTDPPAEALSLRAEARQLEAAEPAHAGELRLEAGVLESRHALAESAIGRAGRFVEPIFKPLGYDWQLSIGLLTSFAAREVFVSTMAVIFAAAEDTNDPTVLHRIRVARRSDGGPVFSRATAASLLVFYVLAMQCLPTLPVTKRETGSWWWAVLQFSYMFALAYGAAFLTYQALRLAGVS